jgi:hypothetical protein
MAKPVKYELNQWCFGDDFGILAGNDNFDGPASIGKPCFEL